MTYRPLTNIPRAWLAADVQAAIEKAESGSSSTLSPVNFVASSGFTQTLADAVIRPVNRVTLTQNCQITLPAPVLGARVLLFAQQDNTGGRTITWKTSIKWRAASIPTQSLDPGDTDWFEFWCVDGASWIGMIQDTDLRTPLGTPATQLLLDKMTAQANGAYSLRKLRAGYLGSAVRVQRASDNTEQDIAFTSSGDFDTTTLATFCAGTTGYVKVWYDQSGSDNNLTATAQVNMLRAFASGTWEKENSRATLRSIDAFRGCYTQTPTVLHNGPAVSGAVVGMLKSTATNYSPRYLSIFGTNLADNTTNQGVNLIGRNGGPSPTEQWAMNRVEAVRAAGAGNFDVLEQVDAVINDAAGTYSMAVDGQETTTTGVTLGNFSATRIGVGYLGSGFQSVAGQATSEVIYFKTALTTTDRQTVRANQATYYGTGNSVQPPDPTAPSYLGPLIAQDNYENGQYTASNLGVLNGGHMTSFGGAWMSDMVSISGGALNIGVKLNATAQTVTDPNASGGSYQSRKRGGYVAWYAVGATRRGGVWVWDMQVPGASNGWGFVPLLWPSDEQWPMHGEIDGPPELFSGNTNKTGGECFVHWSANQGASSTHIQKRVPGSGSFGLDFTQRHKCAVAWHPGTNTAGDGCYVKFYIDDVLRGQILANDPADSSGRTGRDYIPHGTNAVAMNLRLQSEGYGTSEANTAVGPLYWKIFNMKCYALP